eukprot:TRINITY_DN14527_c0_g1_i1.p1 TRINITY_DN14527_c0_g1~~TRINITY_DN14527_c0_g1_i1.p1  ORF type:complete len:210 (+),score=26.78 TRINITY_DN14527_c0_g1_i1:96-725(+)
MTLILPLLLAAMGMSGFPTPKPLTAIPNTWTPMTSAPVTPTTDYPRPPPSGLHCQKSNRAFDFTLEDECHAPLTRASWPVINDSGCLKPICDSLLGRNEVVRLSDPSIVLMGEAHGCRMDQEVNVNDISTKVLCSQEVTQSDSSFGAAAAEYWDGGGIDATIVIVVALVGVVMIALVFAMVVIHYNRQVPAHGAQQQQRRSEEQEMLDL